jgi:hypothetical protein
MYDSRTVVDLPPQGSHSNLCSSSCYIVTNRATEMRSLYRKMVVRLKDVPDPPNIYKTKLTLNSKDQSLFLFFSETL